MSDFTPLPTPKNKREPIMIYDFSATDETGQQAWYLLGVLVAREEAFNAAIQQKGTMIDVKQYGRILASGYGSQPPESVRQEIMAKYADEAS